MTSSPTRFVPSIEVQLTSAHYPLTEAMPHKNGYRPPIEATPRHPLDADGKMKQHVNKTLPGIVIKFEVHIAK